MVREITMVGLQTNVNNLLWTRLFEEKLTVAHYSRIGIIVPE